MRRAVIAALVIAGGCGTEDSKGSPGGGGQGGDETNETAGSSGSAGSGNGRAGASGKNGGGTSGSGVSGSKSTAGHSGGGIAGRSGQAGARATAGVTGVSPNPGDPGCGLESAAFCDTFDAISPKRGRAGDLDPTRWSLSRGEPQLPTSGGIAFGIGPATLPACRAGLPAKIFPDDDSLICDPNDAIGSNHLLVSVGAQNYGQNSYRIRQPFDFAGRTGKIVFDAESFMHPLLGWISIALTEDPAPIPSYSIGSDGQTNDEGGASPRSGFIAQFTGCSSSANQFSFRMIDVFDDYRDTLLKPSTESCVPSKEGHLSRFELRVSQKKIEVYATPYSEDGADFGPLALQFGADVDLPFSRGYVQLTVHNHATLKYSETVASRSYDAWFTRWDNVGFDGPVVNDFREYEIPDSLVAGENSFNIAGPVMSVGYIVPEGTPGPAFSFQAVDLEHVASARLALASWYLNQSDSALETYVLKFRFNGKTWRERPLTSGEIALLRNGHSQGALSQVMDVPVSDLVDGENTLELVTVNVPRNYPPAVSSIDLVLTTE